MRRQVRSPARHHNKTAGHGGEIPQCGCLFDYAMPIYEYLCPQCGHKFEELVHLADAHGQEPCPKCGTSSPHIISHTSFVLKGGGWYVDDYGYRKGIKEDGKEGGSDGGAGSGVTGSSQSGPPAGQAGTASSSAAKPASAAGTHTGAAAPAETSSTPSGGTAATPAASTASGGTHD